MLEVRLLYKKLANANQELERQVRERTAELRESEARYRSLTELASDWYGERSETGNFPKVAGPGPGVRGVPSTGTAVRKCLAAHLGLVFSVRGALQLRRWVVCSG